MNTKILYGMTLLLLCNSLSAMTRAQKEAVQRRQEERALELVDHLPTVEKALNAFLLDRVRHNDIAQAHDALKAGAHAYHRYATKLRPVIHQAVMNDNKAMVQLLLRKKAYVDAQDTDGKTALDIAREDDNRDMIELLLSYKK